MPDIVLRFNKDMLVCEGAMGTMLLKQGMPAGECPEYLNVLDPEMVLEVHKYYKLAGSQCAITNTFGGTRAKLKEYGLEDRVEEFNIAGVLLARQQQPEHVLADIGPCGLVMEPLGQASFDEMFAQYFEQASALAKAGPDAILIETMVDIADARCAVLAARAACDLPIMVTCTFNQSGRMDLSGTQPATAAIILEAAGASVVGLNCGLGPEQMYPLLCEMAAATTLPLLIQPNAGLPKIDAAGNTFYPGTPDEMASWAIKYREAGAQFIGSCCGSTPAYTGAINAAIANLDVVPRHKKISGTVLAGPRGYVQVGDDAPACILGERINPTGKPQLAQELSSNSMSMVRSFASQQLAAGASILDVNVGAPCVDEEEALTCAVKALTASVGVPLALDTTNYRALEHALRIYPGRALINSCNGSPSSYETVLPLAKRYGAAVVILALDETGIPPTAEGRVAIVERVRKAAHAYGLTDKDLIVDTLTMTAATDSLAPKVTLDALATIHKQGIATVLGVSNVSHGLPNRPLLNAAFIQAAIAAGLDVAIANPNNQVVVDAVRTAALSQHESSEHFYEAWTKVYIAATQQAAAGLTALTAEAEADSSSLESPRLALRKAVLQGDVDAVPTLVDQTIAGGVLPGDIIPCVLTPAIQELGDAFGRGEIFLPQMMVAADAMKAGVTRAKEHMPADAPRMDEGRVIFCTVKGDIHSIGKDICISLLESQGFEVFDLGVDVAPESVLEAVREHEADVVCLSALMTTTLPSMKQTAGLVASFAPDVEVLVGGAVVTKAWADSIGVGYSKDAPDCVHAVRVCVGLRRTAHA